MVKVHNKTGHKIHVMVTKLGGEGDDKWYTLEKDKSDGWTRKHWEVLVFKFDEDDNDRSAIYLDFGKTEEITIKGRDRFYHK
jgi:hypothetical protein